jgi:2',3'-cyclic-nucleotide 2'-phosphodiesterase (5'-nucleotidase family)
MRPRSAARVLIATVLGLAAVAQRAAAPTAAGAQPEPPPAATVAPSEPPTENPDLLLFQTGDVLGYVTTCGCRRNPAGGLARRAWILGEVTAGYPSAPRLLLDSGNFSDNPTADGILKTRTLLEAMKRLGYEVVNVGERDIRVGYDEFHRVTEGSPLRFVSANIVRQDTLEPIFEPHVVLEAVSVDGQHKRRVGIVGAVRYNPIFLKAGPGESSMVLAPPGERVKREVEVLRTKDVEAIILLAAMPKDDASRIAESVPGIDFVLGSYGGFHTEEPERYGGAALFYPGNRGQRVIEVRAFLGEQWRAESRVHFLTREYKNDPAMVELVNSVGIVEPEEEPEGGPEPAGAAPGSASDGPAAPGASSAP